MRNRWRQHRLQAPTLFLDEETKEFTKRDTRSTKRDTRSMKRTFKDGVVTMPEEVEWLLIMSVLIIITKKGVK